MSERKVIRVEIEHDDGSIIRLTDAAECEKWRQMCEGQAILAFVHGMRPEPLSWEEFKRTKETAHD